MKPRIGRKVRPPLGIAGFVVVAGLALSGPVWPQEGNETARLDEVQTEFSDAFDAIAAYSVDRRDAALDALRNAFSGIDDQIEVLDDRARNAWSQMSDATRQRTAAALRDLRDRRNDLSEAFGALSQGAGSAWDDLMAGVRAGWANLELA